MAVQKSRKTPSRRGMRRAHDRLVAATLSVESETGELHRRHHISPEGWYKGRHILVPKVQEEAINETKE